MLFFRKKPNESQSVLDARSVLRWSRSSQEYVPWYEIERNGKNHFKKYFDNQKHALIEFEKEWSILPNFSEFSEVINLVWERSKKIMESQPKIYKPPVSQFELRFTPKGNESFLIQPVVAYSTPAPFASVKYHPLNLSLELCFDDQKGCEEQFSRKQLEWQKKLELDALDTFLMRESAQRLRQLCKADRDMSAFDSLLSILRLFDKKMIKSADITSQAYLKDVWGVPNYVFSMQPDLEVMTAIRIQRSFEQFRQQLYLEIKSYYFAELLSWSLFHYFDPLEQEQLLNLFNVGKGVTSLPKKLMDECYQLYALLLERCGIRTELGYVYGTDAFLARVVNALAALPKISTHPNGETEGNHEVYTLLLEDVARFGIRNSQVVRTISDILLNILIGFVVRRLANFQDRKIKEETDFKTAVL